MVGGGALIHSENWWERVTVEQNGTVNWISCVDMSVGSNMLGCSNNKFTHQELEWLMKNSLPRNAIKD